LHRPGQGVIELGFTLYSHRGDASIPSLRGWMRLKALDTGIHQKPTRVCPCGHPDAGDAILIRVDAIHNRMFI